MVTENKDLSHYIGAMQKCSILVVGDIMLDRFVYGDVNRISPESPVPILSIKRENSMLGGAGNVLSNLAGLGVKSYILSVIGEDEAGHAVQSLVKERGIDPDQLVTVSQRPTTIKTRYLATHQQLLRTDFEEKGSIDTKIEEEILKRAEKLIAQVQAVVLSDYGKGALTEKIIGQIVALAQKKNIPVLVDPKGSDYSIYKGADIVTPNRKELSEATGNMAVDTDENIVSAARKIMNDSGIHAVVATRSQDGMSIIQADTAPIHLRTEALEVFDVSGAGDTVIATIAAGLAAGANLIESVALANKAGSIVVAKSGTASVHREELLAALNKQDLDIKTEEDGNAAIIDRVREARICNEEEMLECAKRWKMRGLKIGFTNGCFDILHTGHITYLNQARNKCDRLIIGLNADESVKRLKGATRPLNDEIARATVLGALGAVDIVIIFGKKAEETDKPCKLIEKLQPDIFFKGGDYTLEQLPEASVVQSYGGEVFIMPHCEGHSTTATIDKMKTQVA